VSRLELELVSEPLRTSHERPTYQLY